MKRLPLLLLLSVLLAVGGCAEKNIRPSEELLDDQARDLQYVAKPGDVLKVNVWGEPRLSGEVFVREDGRFTMPLINDISAQGKSLKQINGDISNRLKEFIPAVSVTTNVVQAAPTRYYLSGQFNRPGEYRSTTEITLLQAIATGGGFAPFADESSVMLIRKTSEGELRYRLDYNLVVEGSEPNPKLKDGDIIAIK